MNFCLGYRGLPGPKGDIGKPGTCIKLYLHYINCPQPKRTKLFDYEFGVT